ncbi:MAG: trigger factor [Dehalococcoidales bacterium]|nr:trigger factor [Dehalococcoidales bacterium]
MKVTKEKIENCQAFLSIEMEPEEVEESLEKSYHRLVKKNSVPGFRKGKAPRDVLERHIGKESLFEDTINNLIPEAYKKALQEQNIEAFTQPEIEVTQADPLIFKATVPLPPTINLGDYQNIQVEPETIEVTEDDINTAIEQLQHQHATWEPVERPIAFSDLAVINVESNIEDVPFINQKDAQYRVMQELPLPVPGFAEQLVGMNRDEEKEFKIKLPADYAKSELAEKEPVFKVLVKEIKQEKLPELNDEFAQTVNPEFNTIDVLKEKISAELNLRAIDKAKATFEEKTIDAAVNTTEMEFPPILVEMEIDQLINQQLRRWQMDGSQIEQYLNIINKTEQELRQELHPLATKRVTQSLMLGKIAEGENIKVDETEIDTEINDAVERTNEDKEKLKDYLNAPQARNSIRQSLLTQKTIQKLVDIASGKNTTAEIIETEDKNE